MAKSSIHIEPGNSGYFSHNSRQSFSQSQVFYDEENEIDKTKEEAFKMFRSELAPRIEAYEKRVGQILQRNTIIHLSAIINLEKHHTINDLNPIMHFISNRLDTKIIQNVIHRDEGKLVHKLTGETLTSGEQFFCNPADHKLYFDQEYKEPIDMSQWNMEKNYHAHVEILGIDSTGKSIRRNLTTTFFRELQDLTAQTLGMERGQRTKSYTKEQMIQITSAIGKKNTYNNEKEYASAFVSKAKELGIYINKYESKRKDTHRYKKDKAIENKATTEAIKGMKAKATKSNKAKRATIKQLKDFNKELRAELQQSGGTREEYAVLEEEIRQLKQQIKDKELTETELNQKITILTDTIQKNNRASKVKDQTISDQEAKISKLEDLAYTTVIKKTNVRGKTLSIPQKVSFKELNEIKDEEIKALKTTITSLEKQSPKMEIKEVEKIIYREDTDHILELEEKTYTQGQTITDQENEISLLTTQNEALTAEVSTLPSSDTLEKINTLKSDLQKKDEEYWELWHLAYDDDCIIHTVDNFGMSHDKVASFKERYEVSAKENVVLHSELSETTDQINILKEGYSQIENTLFENDENRPIETIVKEVTTIVAIVSNISKYLNLGMEKIKGLFGETVPDQEEVEKAESWKIESTLSTNVETNYSSEVKPIKP